MIEYDASCFHAGEFEREYTFWLDVADELHKRAVMVSGVALPPLESDAPTQ